MENLQTQYKTRIIPQLQKELSIKNVMALPRLTKIVVNMGVKDALTDKKSIERGSQILMQVTGQKSRVSKAKKSIASFKLREGDAIAVVVTLRGKRMYDFFDKIVRIVLPRLRDFHGTNRKSFDGHGNYTLGFSEFTTFPEIDPGKTEGRVQGFEVVMVTSAKNNEQGMALLTALGMPFAKGN